MLDTVNTITTGNLYWKMLVTCRRNTSYGCTLALPWQLSVTLVTNCTVAFCVQCFYAHRVWIMSARNKLLICAVLTCSCAQLVVGMILLAEGNSTHNITTLFDTWFGAFDGISCAVCDAIITISVFIYLRPLRNSPVRYVQVMSLCILGRDHRDVFFLSVCTYPIVRKVHYIHRFNFLFVQMGLITLVTTLMVAILAS
ncbi:hypothetical protein V8B97DRAFT_1961770 [Scleroderma yunnanense]